MPSRLCGATPTPSPAPASTRAPIQTLRECGEKLTASSTAISHLEGEEESCRQRLEQVCSCCRCSLTVTPLLPALLTMPCLASCRGSDRTRAGVGDELLEGHEDQGEWTRQSAVERCHLRGRSGVMGFCRVTRDRGAAIRCCCRARLAAAVRGADVSYYQCVAETGSLTDDSCTPAQPCVLFCVFLLFCRCPRCDVSRHRHQPRACVSILWRCSGVAVGIRWRRCGERS